MDCLGDLLKLCYEIDMLNKKMQEELINSFLESLSESIELEDGILKEDTNLEDIEWDSLAVISCIALADEHFNVMITGEELANSKTIQDIINLISMKI